MNIPSVSLATKLAAGAVGLLIVGGGAAAVIHDRQIGGQTTVQAAAPAPSSSPSPGMHSPATAKNKASAMQLRIAIGTAEAQVLGINRTELAADLKQGKTVQQLASDKGLTEDQYRSQYQVALKPLLAPLVQNGTLTSAQENRVLQAKTIPNWNKVPKKPATSPSPSPQT
ncbi:MAG: hypothetical protein M3Y62_05995 [Candidatus Dormibacteraeota bacterium]|nr:hypothetical protein [Candidatus Dormibacteraeota bacterium]